MAKSKLFQALNQAIKRDAAAREMFYVLKHGFEWIPQPNYSCDPLRYHINSFFFTNNNCLKRRFVRLFLFALDFNKHFASS